MRLGIVIGVMLLVSSGIYAQEGESSSRYESLKISYITRQLDLTPKEAQKFWPIYNEHQAKMKAVKAASSKLPKSEEEIDAYSEVELEAMLAKRLEGDLKEATLKKAFYERIYTALPSKKVAKLYVAERKFRARVVRALRGERTGSQR